MGCVDRDRRGHRESQMKAMRRLSRRSFLGRVAGGAIAGGAALVLPGGTAEAQVTDTDRGPNADAPGRGRGATDSDSGGSAGPAGRGRGGTSDSDSGPNADPAGRGRGSRGSGITDSD